MGDGRKVKNCIGRAADAHIHCDRIFKRLKRHDVTRKNLLFDEADNSLTCTLGEQTTCSRIRRRNRTVARKSHTEHFRQRIHRVRGEKTSARAAAWAAL